MTSWPSTWSRRPSRILPEVTRGPGRWVVRTCDARGGHVHLQTQLHLRRGRPRGAVRRRGVRLRADRVDGGQRREPGRGAAHRPALDERGYVIVGADLRVVDLRQPEARSWTMRGPPATTRPYPTSPRPTPGARTVPNAQHAVRQGKVLGGNLVAAIRGGTPQPYVHHSLGVVATLGLGHGHLPVPPDRHQGTAGLADAPRLPRAGRPVLGAQDPGPARSGWPPALFGRDIVSLADIAEPRDAFVRGGVPRPQVVRATAVTRPDRRDGEDGVLDTASGGPAPRPPRGWNQR